MGDYFDAFARAGVRETGDAAAYARPQRQVDFRILARTRRARRRSAAADGRERGDLPGTVFERPGAFSPGSGSGRIAGLDQRASNPPYDRDGFGDRQRDLLHP